MVRLNEERIFSLIFNSLTINNILNIIILLILAGISIASLTQKGLFAKTQQAKNETENAQAEENEILANYLEQIEAITGTTPSAWTWTDTDGSKTKNIGDVVTHSSGEKFYIISTANEKYALLAEKNIGVNKDDTKTYLKQSNNATTIAFSENNGWAAGDDLNGYNKGSLKTDGSSAVYYAVQYGGKFEGAEGRLMTVGEVKDITGLTGMGTISSPDWIKTTNYWLGSADSTSNVWGVYGEDSGLYRSDFGVGGYYGLRPVIEISKSEI